MIRIQMVQDIDYLPGPSISEHACIMMDLHVCTEIKMGKKPRLHYNKNK